MKAVLCLLGCLAVLVNAKLYRRQTLTYTENDFVADDLVLRNGHYYHIVDDCDIYDPNSCEPGRCCEQKGVMYNPEAAGPWPKYRLSCQPHLTENQQCWMVDYHQACPCGNGLECTSLNPDYFQMFGRCFPRQ